MQAEGPGFESPYLHHSDTPTDSLCRGIFFILRTERRSISMFEIHLNGMVYRFDDNKLLEIMDMLDERADEVVEEGHE